MSAPSRWHRAFGRPGGPGCAWVPGALFQAAGAVRGAEAGLGAAPGAPSRKDPAAAAPLRASLVPVPTLRRLRRLRSAERDQRLLPLPPPPLPNTEPERGRLPRQSVRLRSCQHFSERARAGDACVRVCAGVCARVCAGVAETVTRAVSNLQGAEFGEVRGVRVTACSLACPLT